MEANESRFQEYREEERVLKEKQYRRSRCIEAATLIFTIIAAAEPLQKLQDGWDRQRYCSDRLPAVHWRKQKTTGSK